MMSREEQLEKMKQSNKVKWEMTKTIWKWVLILGCICFLIDKAPGWVDDWKYKQKVVASYNEYMEEFKTGNPIKMRPTAYIITYTGFSSTGKDYSSKRKALGKTRLANAVVAETVVNIYHSEDLGDYEYEAFRDCLVNADAFTEEEKEKYLEMANRAYRNPSPWDIERYGLEKKGK